MSSLLDLELPPLIIRGQALSYADGAAVIPASGLALFLIKLFAEETRILSFHLDYWAGTYIGSLVKDLIIH